MKYKFYYSNAMEKDIHYWMAFLKNERGITKFPNIPAEKVTILAWHDGKEVCFKRIGARVGQLIINKYNNHGQLTESHPLYPYIMYEEGEMEDNLIIDKELKKNYENEQREIIAHFQTHVKEGIVSFT